MVVALGCLLFGLATLKPENLAAYDQPLYLGIASDLQRTGVYTNGRWGEAGKPGAYTAPLYPGLIAAVAALDPDLAEAAACVRIAPWAAIPSCPGSLGLLVPLQVALLAGTLLLVWRSTLAIGGSRSAAWVALLAAGAGHHGIRRLRAHRDDGGAQPPAGCSPPGCCSCCWCAGLGY